MAPRAQFEAIQPSPGSGKFAPVVANDGVDLAWITQFIIVGTGGVMKVTCEDGTTVTITVPAGELHLRVSRIWATGLTAANITACY